MKEISKYQQAIYDTFKLTNRNISISAVAGSGKTTTLLGLFSHIPNNSSSLFLAFNNSIVDELKQRAQGDNTNIMTIHSCGWRSILRCYGGKIKMNPNKAMAKTETVIKRLGIPAKKQGFYFYAIPKVMDLMRCNLCENTPDAIDELLDHYDINLGGDDIKAIQLAFKLMDEDRKQFDFMDMIYVPVVDKYVKMKVQKYDYVFCDESQDFSKAQQEFIKICLNRKGRLVTVGDKNQAIYGFAGADADSYDRLASLMGEAIKLPLSVSYRCAKNIVREARQIVPTIDYAEDAEEGLVIQGSLTSIQQGDWILCRNLKPLVQTYLWLMKNKVKSKIRGKEIGEGILALIEKTGASTLLQLQAGLDYEYEKLIKHYETRGCKNPKAKPSAELMEQRIEVIMCLMEEVSTLNELKRVIENIFSDDVKGIMLSTIHKSKGLENERIFFLCPELIPSKYATMPWEFEQENNLKYVAITRAKKELIYVSTDTFIVDLAGKVSV